jgi:hypothetical protein
VVVVVVLLLLCREVIPVTGNKHASTGVGCLVLQLLALRCLKLLQLLLLLCVASIQAELVVEG